MDQHLEMVTFTFPAAHLTRHILTLTLAILTAYQAGASMGATLLKLSCQDHISLYQTK